MNSRSWLAVPALLVSFAFEGLGEFLSRTGRVMQTWAVNFEMKVDSQS